MEALSRVGQPWTTKEIERLIEDADLFTLRELAEMYHRSVGGVRAEAYKLGINVRTKPRGWTAEQVLTLRIHASNCCKHGLSELIEGKDPDPIYAYARKHGIDIAPCDHAYLHRGENLQQLRRLAPTHTYKELARKLSFTPDTVRAVCCRLGIKVKLERVPWTDKELEFLHDYYRVLTREELGDNLGRTPCAVGAKMGELGLSVLCKDGRPLNVKSIMDDLKCTHKTVYKAIEALCIPYTKTSTKAAGASYFSEEQYNALKEYIEQTRRVVPKWDPADDEELIALSADHTPGQIGQALGVNKRRVCRRLKVLGIAAYRPKFWTHQRVNALRKMRKQYSRSETARRMGVSEKAISNATYVYDVEVCDSDR